MVGTADTNASTGKVSVVDLKGNHTVLFSGWLRSCGLAWSPGGDEVWFALPEAGGARALYAVKLNGEKRLVTSMFGALTLQSIARDGRILMTRETARIETMG